MAKGKHRDAQRVLLPNGMWVLLYENGDIKIGAYDHRFTIHEITTRGAGNSGAAPGTSVHLHAEPTSETPTRPVPRGNDLVAIPHRTWEAISASLSSTE